MIDVASALSSFPHVPPDSQPDTLQAILDHLASLEGTVTALQEENAALRAQIATQDERLAAFEKDFDHASEQDMIQLKLIQGLKEKISSLETRTIEAQVKPAAHAGAGDLTKTRIKKLQTFLRSHGGSRTFKECRDHLGLTPSEFTRLVSCLDMRAFEVFQRPNCRSHEKVLRLKTQWQDLAGVMMKR